MDAYASVRARCGPETVGHNVRRFVFHRALPRKASQDETDVSHFAAKDAPTRA